MRLRDKVAIVTGASSGIGEAVAVAFAREGASVAIDYYGNAEQTRTVVESIEAHGGRAVAVGADVSKEEDVKKLVEAAVADFGSLDILVNNAGIEHQMPFLETPLDVWRRVIETNLTGTWICSRLAAREMAKRKRGGRIINISSVHEDVTMPSNAPYCASKGGLKMLMRTIAVELAPLDITVNNVCPAPSTRRFRRTSRKIRIKSKSCFRRFRCTAWGRPRRWRACACSWRARKDRTSPARPTSSTAE